MMAAPKKKKKLGRPLKADAKKDMVTVRLTEDMHEMAKRAAHWQRSTLAKVVKDALEKYIEKAQKTYGDPLPPIPA